MLKVSSDDLLRPDSVLISPAQWSLPLTCFAVYQRGDSALSD
jgi:hypothetical protein